MARSRRESRHNDGITDQKSLQRTSGHCASANGTILRAQAGAVSMIGHGTEGDAMGSSDRYPLVSTGWLSVGR
jgi:hypothetical protein